MTEAVEGDLGHAEALELILYWMPAHESDDGAKLTQYIERLRAALSRAEADREEALAWMRPVSARTREYYKFTNAAGVVERLLYTETPLSGEETGALAQLVARLSRTSGSE